MTTPSKPSSLATAVQWAFLRPLPIPGAPGELYTLVASTAYYLSLFQGGGPVFFSRKHLGELFQTTPRTIGRVLSLLVKAKLLAVENPEWSYLKGECKTYRVLIGPEGVASKPGETPPGQRPPR